MHVDARIHGRPCVGETRSGDAGLVHTVGAVTWVLLVDALGHGDQAADVAELAIDEARRFETHSVEVGLQRLHVRLAGSRGAAAALLRFGGHEISLSGVGNVEVRTLRGVSAPYIAARGIIGRRMPPLQALAVEISAPGRLLLYTDGISRRAPLYMMANLDAEVLCTTLLAQHSVERDDATVIHVSYSPSS